VKLRWELIFRFAVLSLFFRQPVIYRYGYIASFCSFLYFETKKTFVPRCISTTKKEDQSRKRFLSSIGASKVKKEFDITPCPVYDVFFKDVSLSYDLIRFRRLTAGKRKEHQHQ